ncbi:hydantoinase/oxoprolinase family protein [Rhodococcus wratislaviensis]|uniref:Hydantoinase A n=1 Tax=Rhodococcus wratislaviensis NBRC 100605 TaxID=1219028 RepID=X0RAV2_RHOWR|nr:hydantoinase/oxoprolinase family protein [Rhodococcus wratislaviensis]GAF48130.1 hydantoinase A [Rhodococcus wratislaviensis NBRC 100605]
MTRTYSVGVDVGGSFTDIALTTPNGTHRAKAPTNPQDFSDGVLTALELVATHAGCTLTDLLPRIARMGLGTTAVTNVIAALSGTTVGLLTTAGFEGELAVSNGIRPSGPDGRVHAPELLVPIRNTVGLHERIDRFGEVLHSLDETEVLEAARHLIEDRGAAALAVSLMSAYANPSHEHRAAQLIRAAHPNVPVFAATELSPTIGFFQRTMFAVLNAYSADAIDGVEDLLDELQRLGLAVPVKLMNASGGAIGVGAARRAPMNLMHSGPSGGVAAAAELAARHGLDKVIAADMGGTSFDISMITDGQPFRRLNAEVLEVPTSMSAVDVRSIGSGGGSIAWTDRRGMLRVGPRSARSFPGPACYGRGGTDPTVTDALLVLGFIDPDHFLGGSMTLDLEAATAACAHVGEPIGLDAIGVARGIWTLALADMVAAVRMVFNRRGLDVREYSIVSYGGCGSLFTAAIGQALGVRHVVVPEVASVFSAFGAATANIRRERTQSVAVELPTAPTSVEAVVVQLLQAVHLDLDEERVPADARRVTLEADLRYKRQRFDLSVAFQHELSIADALEHAEKEFFELYTRIYGTGSSLLGAPVELVTLRAIGMGTIATPAVGDASEATEDAGQPAPVGVRTVDLPGSAQPLNVDWLDETALHPGVTITGPACIDKVDTTVWLPPGATATVAADRTLILDLSATIPGAPS